MLEMEEHSIWEKRYVQAFYSSFLQQLSLELDFVNFQYRYHLQLTQNWQQINRQLWAVGQSNIVVQSFSIKTHLKLKLIQRLKTTDC